MFVSCNMSEDSNPSKVTGQSPTDASLELNAHETITPTTAATAASASASALALAAASAAISELKSFSDANKNKLQSELESCTSCKTYLDNDHNNSSKVGGCGSDAVSDPFMMRVSKDGSTLGVQTGHIDEGMRAELLFGVEGVVHRDRTGVDSIANLAEAYFGGLDISADADSDDEEFLDREAEAQGDVVDDNESIGSGSVHSVDDWENDEDIGVILVHMSETDFFNMEEKAMLLANMKKNAAATAASTAAEPIRTSGIRTGTAAPSVKDEDEDQDEDVNEDSQSNTSSDYDDDVLEVTAMLNSARTQQQQEQTTSINSIDGPPINAWSATTFKNANVTQQKLPQTTATATHADADEGGNECHKEIGGQESYIGIDGLTYGTFNLKVVFEPFKTGFEDIQQSTFNPPAGTLICGRYEVEEILGTAAFSTAIQCIDLLAQAKYDINTGEQKEEIKDQWVCLKVIKYGKDYFDQSLDEIKLLQYINSRGDPDEKHVLRLIDYFYAKERLFLVTELLRENLYEFGKAIMESGQSPYFVLSRLKLISKQVLKALEYIHSLNLVHCDIKPENIVMKSYSKCLVKLIDFGSSCFNTDRCSTYIQSRSYRAPEVILGHAYDGRIDIWSLGAVIAEMHTGYVLFQNDSLQTMLARIISILGPFPTHVLDAGRQTSKYFTVSHVVYDRIEADEEEEEEEEEEENGDHNHGKAATYVLLYPKTTSLENRLHVPSARAYHRNAKAREKVIKRLRHQCGDENPRVTKLQEECAHAHAQEEEVILFVDFLRQLLTLDPSKRPTAAEALRHPWLNGADEFNLKKLNDDEGRWDKQPTQDQQEDEEEEDDEDEDEDNEGDWVDEDDDDSNEQEEEEVEDVEGV